MSETPTARDRAPLVSVLVATHNFERFIARAIDSVLAQDYPAAAIEVIVVDDGSTDNTAAVVERYGDRVRYVKKPNGGLISTINRGLAEASGELIALFSGDDVYLPDKTRRQVDFLSANPNVGLVYGDLEVVDDGDRVLHPSFWQLYQITPLRGHVFGRLLRANVVSGGTLMVRAALKHEFHPIPAIAPAEDWYIALRVAAVAEIDYLTGPVYRYRYHGANMNLCAQGDKQVALVRGETHFRRSMLQQLRAGAATPTEILAACDSLRSGAAHVSAATGERVPVTDTDRDRAAAALDEADAALGAGDRETAAARFANAFGHDPGDPRARTALARLAPVPSAPTLAALDGARSFRTLAFADELLSAPVLLHAYTQAFAGGDDATLVIHVGDGLLERLVATVAELGLDGPESADMLALASGAPLDEVVAQADAVYSLRRPDPALGARTWTGDPGVLRALASA